MTRHRETWRAGPDGIAHLHRGRLPRTACDEPAIGDQFAWPGRRRCLACLAQQATSSLPEELLMAGYGVRVERPIGS
jgi:hypothetical protein